jgi:two-component sensor histidine kinase
VKNDIRWIGSHFARLSTGVKMLLILSLSLLPLGIIAILASIQSAQANRTDRYKEIQQRIELSAQRLNAALARNAATIRAAGAAIAASGDRSPVCERTLVRLSSTEMLRGAYALYDDSGRLRCATPGYRPPETATGTPNGSMLILSSDDTLELVLFRADGGVEAIGDYLKADVADLVATRSSPGGARLELRQGASTMVLHDTHRSGPLTRTVVLSSPIGGGQTELRIVAGLVPISATELLLILMPVVMWISAAVIGWLIVNGLLLKPLVRMQRAVSSYRPGDTHLALPLLATPAREIGDLGAAFDQLTRTVARHEADLEAAVDRQTRLVREVHHRVKNNLQVVASLLNLHSRGAVSEDAAAAYASIQRRVDALAVVHRNHYAELEENRGVALKPLVSELAANLRATAPRSAAGMSVALHVEALHVTQDVAVSVAFLITEMVEFAMLSGASGVRISVTAAGPALADFRIESDSLRDEAPREEKLLERFDRIITGLSRQLRSMMIKDGVEGIYALQIAVLERPERPPLQ